MTIQPMTRVPPMANEMDAIFKMLKKEQGNWDRVGDWDPLPASPRLCFLSIVGEWVDGKQGENYYSSTNLFVRIFLLTCIVGWGAKANCKSDADSLSLLAAFSSWIASLFITLLFISETNEYADSCVSRMQQGGGEFLHIQFQHEIRKQYFYISKTRQFFIHTKSRRRDCDNNRDTCSHLALTGWPPSGKNGKHSSLF